MSKRDTLIDTALDLFYRFGIHAVGINEVLAQSGIAKKTLYKYFPSKDDLIVACVVERDRRFTQWLSKRCQNSDSVIVLIEEIFSALDDWINNRAPELGPFNGCFFINTAAEYSDESCDIYRQCKQHKNNIKRIFSDHLSSNILNENRAELMLDTLLLLKEGAINSAFVMGDKQAANKAKKIALNLLYK